MNPRATGWLALATAALALFVYFYEIRGEPGRRAAADAEGRLFPDLEPGDVAALWIQRPGEDQSRAKRSGDGWQLALPVEWPGDPSSLDAMARALSQMKSQGRIEDPAAPAVYGLGEDAILVSFSAESGTRGLRIGRQTPVGPNVYVALLGSGDEPEAIHMISSAHAAVFDRGPEDLRDRRVLDVEPAKVERLEIETRGIDVAVERDGEAWWIVRPERAPADAGKLGRLLSDLSVLRAESFVDEGREAEEAVETAETVITLTGRELPDAVRLRLGPVADGRRLAQGRDGRLYTVREALVSHLPTSVEELRQTQTPESAGDAGDAGEEVELTPPS